MNPNLLRAWMAIHELLNSYENRIVNHTPKEIIRALLGRETIEFMEWAFGVQHNSITCSIHLVNMWNMRHRYMLDLKTEGILCADIPIMIDLWKLSKQLNAYN